jgi:integrase
MNVRYTEVALRELDDILAFIASNYPTASQLYGTHSLRRIKATLLYRRTWNLRAVQLLLGHRRIDYVPRRTMSCRAVTWFIFNENGGRIGT